MVNLNPLLANFYPLAIHFAREENAKVRKILTDFISKSMTLTFPFLVAQCNALYLDGDGSRHERVKQ